MGLYFWWMFMERQGLGSRHKLDATGQTGSSGGHGSRNSLPQHGAPRPRLARDGRAQYTVADKALEMTTSHEATCCPPPSFFSSFLPSLPPPGALEINLTENGVRGEPGPGWRSCRGVTRSPHWWNFLLGLLAWSSRSWQGVNWLPYTASYLRSLSTSCRAP